MFDLSTGLVQAARILAAPLWILDILLFAGGCCVAWWWFKGRDRE